MSDAATALREPWPDLDRQREGVSVGIWLFIASEVLFFGALFLGYTVYRTLYPEAFRIAGAAAFAEDERELVLRIREHAPRAHARIHRDRVVEMLDCVVEAATGRREKPQIAGRRAQQPGGVRRDHDVAPREGCEPPI